MGIERIYSPKYFRDRAEEFRAKAANCEHQQTKETPSKVAASYDYLARRAEKVRTVKDVAD
ncbi:hypothetical protein [Bradyrhizobium sp. CB2312]|uniref:hypothetical protein n=1 Tax=Bradyrhizobium sp. CB2312 TaxID=3039155 RepID=UPI0024B24D35|nr:hypothetical protein [Bradyrhizobium sp. CB2312]WFU69247.1 hypothetical protein QA642_28640 [Bradyrhizobium sp. CB2312]